MVKVLQSQHELLHGVGFDAARVVPLDRAPASRTVVSGSDAERPPVVDPVAATRQAWASPLEFPPLAQATVPGDHVALAIDEDLPQAGSLIQGTIEALEEAGVEPCDVAVVAHSGKHCEQILSALGNGHGSAPRVIVHDPDDEMELCVFGYGRRREPLRINRTIFDADVILPIGCARLAAAARQAGVHECLYPQYSDATTIDRLQTPASFQTPADRVELRRETDEAGWLLGVPLTMQAVPGNGGTVAHLVAGDPTAVDRTCQQLCQQRWAFHVARRASLVIATVASGAGRARWNDVARALAVAEPLLEDGGAVAICADLEARPGKSLGRLIRNDDFASVERRTYRDGAEDSWSAWQLARALQRGSVYLLSRLDAEIVEDLGMAPVSNAEELARLATRHESCIVLDDSQHAVVTVAGEDDA